MRKKFNFIKGHLSLFLLFVCIILITGASNTAKAEKVLTLWQLDSQTSGQINSYIIKTPNDKIIVVDGGYKQDAPYLKGFLAALGNSVDLWIVTHPHNDHIAALTEILKKPDGLAIKKICGSMPSEDWVEQVTGKRSPVLKDFNETMDSCGRVFTTLQLGEILQLDKIKLEVLGVKNSEITENAINNSSLVFKMYFRNTSFLFLADLGFEGGEKLLQSEYAGKLKSDYVQMAHHGQQGVSEAFYKKVDPKYCLWPTPGWLWENNRKKQGKNTGPWKTLEVRNWMDKLNVEKYYIMKDGLQKIQI